MISFCSLLGLLLSLALRVSLRLRGWLGSSFSSWLSSRLSCRLSRRLSSRLGCLRLRNLLSRGLHGVNIWQTPGEGICSRNSLLSLSRSSVLNSLNCGRQVLLVLGNLGHDIWESLQCLDVLWRVLVGCDIDLLDRKASAYAKEVSMISSMHYFS